MSDISVGVHFATTSIAHLNLWLNMLVFELHLGDTGAGTGLSHIVFDIVLKTVHLKLDKVIEVLNWMEHYEPLHDIVRPSA